MSDLATLYEMLDGTMTAKPPPQWALDKADIVLGHLEFSLSPYTRKTATTKIANLLAEERELCSTELKQLRKRVAAQRRELRRLNGFYRMYWNGFYRGMNLVQADALRNKMIKAFGKSAVSEAEK